MRGALFLLVLLSAGLWGGLTRVRDYNTAIETATAAYTRGDFTVAAAQYEQAFALGNPPEALRLNLGHAHTRAGHAAQARAAYSSLLSSQSGTMRSVARQQLAALAARQGDYAQATALLRQALLDNPANNGARYDYELLRQYQGQPNSPRIPPPSAQTKPKSGPQSEGDAQTGPAGAGTPQPAPSAAPGNTGPGGRRSANTPPGAGSPTPTPQGREPGNVQGLGTTPDDTERTSQSAGLPPSDQASKADDARANTQRARLQEMNLTEAQAQQVLDALRAGERQYLQQLPHRATRKPEPGRPTW